LFERSRSEAVRRERDGTVDWAAFYDTGPLRAEDLPEASVSADER
jgi:hypothetical protein